ncbi:MAG: bifunctional oligoribonuclease/PAP phosphatase NrnA [Planctomycetes bacterium]|nr:bifunctional oligoribonuclease/PAP phosphatase NrnA [Planctomycetota bacterium]
MPMHDVMEFLRRHSGARFAVLGHARPDGDALGSATALALALRRAGFRADVVNASPIPENLRFLDRILPVARYGEPDWHNNYDCVAVLDCGDVDRLDPVNRQAVQALPACTIDHHATSKGIGEAAWVDSSASATGEMLVNLFQALDWPLSKDAASALWTAIVTDTGRFCYENTTIAAMTAGMECVKAGAEPAQLAQHIYQSVSIAERWLQARVLSRLEFHADGKLGLSWIDDNDFAEAGVGVEGAQGLIDLVRDTAGVEVAIFLYAITDPSNQSDNPVSVKISMRTQSPFNALDVVRPFGGGGHIRAAGATSSLPLQETREKVLAMAIQAFFTE